MAKGSKKTSQFERNFRAAFLMSSQYLTGRMKFDEIQIFRDDVENGICWLPWRAQQPFTINFVFNMVRINRSHNGWMSSQCQWAGYNPSSRTCRKPARRGVRSPTQ